jgi:hypothetical protein
MIFRLSLTKSEKDVTPWICIELGQNPTRVTRLLCLTRTIRQNSSARIQTRTAARSTLHL